MSNKKTLEAPGCNLLGFQRGKDGEESDTSYQYGHCVEGGRKQGNQR